MAMMMTVMVMGVMVKAIKLAPRKTEYTLRKI